MPTTYAKLRERLRRSEQERLLAFEQLQASQVSVDDFRDQVTRLTRQDHFRSFKQLGLSEDLEMFYLGDDLDLDALYTAIIEDLQCAERWLREYFTYTEAELQGCLNDGMAQCIVREERSRSNPNVFADLLGSMKTLDPLSDRPFPPRSFWETLTAGEKVFIQELCEAELVCSGIGKMLHGRKDMVEDILERHYSDKEDFTLADDGHFDFAGLLRRISSVWPDFLRARGSIEDTKIRAKAVNKNE